ncbi:MAG: aldo/keto reductase, partial [Solobacterium sp.]|nr:aldo/keto reductase [Solobacterium sp.]
MEFRPEKKLGFGLMRLPQNDPANAADIDMEQLKQMVDLFMEKGFTYFDTAWMYNGFA